MKLLTIVGARPQFVKAAVVSRALVLDAEIEEVIVHTGQHYDQNLSDVFFKELNIPRPNILLGVGSGSHGVQTGRMLEKLDPILLSEKPDCVLVYGDTNSTLAGALAAAKLHIPVAHVEAGLRSYNRRMPEELNRVTTDHLSNFLFAPTRVAVDNLSKEGIDVSRVYQVGDVMYDAAQHYGVLVSDRVEALEAGFALATIHRAENTDDPVRLHNIVTMLAALAKKMRVIMPLHPRTAACLELYPGTRALLTQLEIVEPLGYLDMVAHERACSAILTDSGGVQKEAFFHGKPCVIFRDETEWPELLEVGSHALLPPHSTGDLFNLIGKLKDSLPIKSLDGRMSLYGDGNAGGLIAKTLRGCLV
ncbi:non-hydrolyzing UDP-N-acetylglucosamine 2-epimerase [Flagellimonas sp.]|uniref:non-hydrolyzing UDP-N-acetylglucosamine 2-epimerase n=1 Tax=Flagellimonas sp. TaxID=2058762 RepID=UPI003AB6AD50